MTEPEWDIPTLKALLDAELHHLRELIDQLEERNKLRDKAQTELFEAAMRAATLAAEKAEIANEKRFESLNRFRDALDNITRSQIPRAEAEQGLNAINQRAEALVRALGDRVDARMDGLDAKVTVGMKAVDDRVGAIIGELQARATTNAQRITVLEASRQGASQHQGMIVGVAAFVLSLILGFVSLYNSFSKSETDIISEYRARNAPLTQTAPPAPR